MPVVSPDLGPHERKCAEQVLSSAEFAYVAMVESADSVAEAQSDEPRSDSVSATSLRPYVTPMNFVYEPHADGEGPAGSEGRLLLHTGPGRKVEALKKNPRICVSVTAKTRLKLGATPCEDGYLYQSVIVEGRALPLSDEAEREGALRAIVTKYDPSAVDRPFDPEIFAQTLLYTVEIDVIGFKERPRQSQEG